MPASIINLSFPIGLSNDCIVKPNYRFSEPVLAYADTTRGFASSLQEGRMDGLSGKWSCRMRNDIW